ncbi:hypothetical protein BN14_09143 [Rhizoctonia solani AG-1 IB]|uniref:AIG1-type G domain-containing protein n=1 Tax=Thanatephorus cucumeris (strain AG1-IB / isolate 7/3/14) TaxID=1108050 RepID=M5C7I6_THACB|nr:hypothetical protein BN14_09143 [Rhizoctonia solani AG-1 IB]
MIRALATMLPRSMSTNVGLLLTNCDSATKKLKTDSLPSNFNKIKSWTFQDPLPFCLSYRAQEWQGAQRQRGRQKRKLEVIYDASVDTSNEIIEWIDQLPVQQTKGMADMSDKINDVENYFEEIIREQLITKNYIVSKSKFDLERIVVKIKLKQLGTSVNKALDNLRQQESRISQIRASLIELVQSIDQDSVGAEFGDYIQASLRALQYHKIRMIPTDDPGKIDKEISRLEMCANILTSEFTEDAARRLPGLIPMERITEAELSVLGPLRTKKGLSILLVGYGPFELEDENDEDAESGLKKQESQTSDATLYTVTSSEGTKIQILDTPGLADTRGIQQDEQHKAKINKAIQEFVITIDAVLIMANGTTERMPAATNYALGTLTSLFPYSIVDNIAFIFTHCDSFTRNLDMASLPEALRVSNRWTLENPLAYHKNYQREVNAGGSESTLKEGRERLESIYKKTLLTLNQWLIWVDARCPQPTHEINRLYQTMVDIEAQIEAAISLMTCLGEQRRELQTSQHNLEDHRTSKSALQELCNKTIDYWEREPSDKHHTLCIASNCYSNCHSECFVPFSLDPAVIGRYCAAFRYPFDDAQRTTMKNDDCYKSRHCNHCPHEAWEHRHYTSKHVKRTKALYPNAVDDLARAETEEQKLEIGKIMVQEGLNITQRELDKVQAKVHSLVDTYNSRSLNRDFAGHINSAIQMMELRLEELNSKPGTEHEQCVVRSGIQKLKSKLDVLWKSQERSSGVFSQVSGVVGSAVGSTVGAFGSAWNVVKNIQVKSRG